MVGVDLDNTIVCYDGLFHQVAVEEGLIPAAVPAVKGAVRDHLRAGGREEDWIALQAAVYGPHMRRAGPFPGVLEFFARSWQRGVALSIISHRTRRPFRGPPHDLHSSALAWIEAHGLLEPAPGGLPADRVRLELTREDKLRRIEELRCRIFIDDLPEFLAEPGFPRGVERVLFDPRGVHAAERRFLRLESWQEIGRHLLEEAALGV